MAETRLGHLEDELRKYGLTDGERYNICLYLLGYISESVHPKLWHDGVDSAVKHVLSKRS